MAKLKQRLECYYK